VAKSGKKGKAGGTRKKAGGKKEKASSGKEKKKGDREEAGRRLTPGRIRAIYGVSFAALAVFTFLCVFASASAGIVGGGVRDAMAWTLGLGRYVVPFAFLAGAVMAFKKPEVRVWLLAVGTAIMFVSVLALLHITTDPSVMFESNELMSGGGVVGAVIAWPLVNLVGTIGAYIFVVAALISGIVIAFEEQISAGWRSLVKKRAGETEQAAPEKTVQGPKPAAERRKGKSQDVKVYPSKPIPTRELQEEPSGQLPMKIAKPKSGKYKLPPISILTKGHDKAFSKQSNEERKKAIEHTLQSMGVDARVVKVSKGPTVSLFEVEVGTGEKVKRVTELEQDIAYALGSPDIRIYSPIPGRQAIGIEVPNNMRDTVLLGDVMQTLEPVKPHNQLTMAVGRGMSGELVVLDLAQLPHLMLAGSTGAGKSCCINSLICCLLFRNRPDEVKLIMIDPKFVEFTWYDGLPHLLCDVINEPEFAAKALLWAVNEMDRRYRLLQKQKVVHIDDYNAIAIKDDELEKLPKIVIVIDELGDLMIVARREVESSISRLTAKARAVGIHMIIATQRPSVDVITGVIKNNITARIAFQVASNVDSRTILGTKGAEKLLGKGDMLLDPGNIPQPERVQGALVQQKEIEFLTGYIKQQKAGDGVSIDLDGVKISTRDKLEDRDPLLDEAAEFVVLAGEASASMLQTTLKVGYARARRIIVEMSELGIVGPHQGSKPRKVLLTPEEFREWKSRSND